MTILTNVMSKPERLWLWLTNDEALYSGLSEQQSERIDGFRMSLFLLLHAGTLGVILTGTSLTAVLVCVMLYIVRMFFITGFYHRYFSHRTFQVNRLLQFCMGLAGCTAGQRGPLWWASHHRYHHVNSDRDNDPHSPRNGLLNSHMLWFLRRGNFTLRKEHIRDFNRYPELKLLEAFDWVPFLLLAAGCYVTGELLAVYFPVLDTSGPQLLVWGFFISTVILYHATYTINSVAHRLGSRRFDTRDDSRNNLLLAILTLGEGWHNNHHRYPASTRQGFYWWELDITYLLLKLMSGLRLITGIKPVPGSVLAEGSGYRS